MKIVLTDTTLQGPLIGGAQTFFPGLLQGLVQLGHEVHLVSSGIPDSRVLEGIKNSGAILHTDLWKTNRLVNDTTPVFANWLNELKPDVYVVSVSPDIGWTVLPHLHPEIATATIGHTDSATFYTPAKHYNPFLTGAIGVSEEIAGHYRNDCQVPASQVEWIPYGVTVNQQPPVPQKGDVLQMIYVGRLEEEQKRVSNLAAVAKKLSSNKVPFHLRMIGNGPEMNSLKETLADEITVGNVELNGWLPSDKVVDALRSSEVFVLMSAYEGFCISLVEAMANGCAPVVTNIKSGNSQLLRNDNNGYLLEIGDVDGFATKLEQLQQQKAKLNNLRGAAWETGKNYSVQRMIERYDRFFKKLANLAKTSPRLTDPGFPLMASCRSRYPLWLRRLKVLATNFTS